MHGSYLDVDEGYEPVQGEEEIYEEVPNNSLYARDNGDDEPYYNGPVHEPTLYGGVEGNPGVDFPTYRNMPQTSFSCDDVPYQPGMYADEEARCQVYHVCHNGRKESFLCAVGTLFNQAILSCDYWHAVDCARTREFYSSNEKLGKTFISVLA